MKEYTSVKVNERILNSSDALKILIMVPSNSIKSKMK
jgi:hypothetical protein